MDNNILKHKIRFDVSNYGLKFSSLIKPWLLYFWSSNNNSTKGWFSNNVRLKLPFLTHLPPIITLCHVSSREPSCVYYQSLVQTGSIPAGNYMFKVNNRNTRTKCEICSKLTIKVPERHQASFWCLYCWLWTYFTPYSSVSTVNFEQVNAGWDHLRQGLIYAIISLIIEKYFIEIFFTVNSQTLIKYHPPP